MQARLAGDVSFASASIPAVSRLDAMIQNPLQPQQQFGPRAAAKTSETTVGLEKCLLHDV